MKDIVLLIGIAFISDEHWVVVIGSSPLVILVCKEIIFLKKKKKKTLISWKIASQD
jgi:hypothetical protein